MIHIWYEMTLSKSLDTWMAEDLGQKWTGKRYVNMQTESKQAEKHPYSSETFLDGHVGWRVWISTSTKLLPQFFCLHRKRRQDSLLLSSGRPRSLLVWVYLHAILPCRSCRTCLLSCCGPWRFFSLQSPSRELPSEGWSAGMTQAIGFPAMLHP